MIEGEHEVEADAEAESSWESLLLLAVLALAPALLTWAGPEVAASLRPWLSTKTTTLALGAAGISAELLAMSVYWGTSRARRIVKIAVLMGTCNVAATLALLARML